MDVWSYIRQTGGCASWIWNTPDLEILFEVTRKFLAFDDEANVLTIDTREEEPGFFEIDTLMEQGILGKRGSFSHAPKPNQAMALVAKYARAFQFTPMMFNIVGIPPEAWSWAGQARVLNPLLSFGGAHSHHYVMLYSEQSEEWAHSRVAVDTILRWTPQRVNIFKSLKGHPAPPLEALSHGARP